MKLLRRKSCWCPTLAGWLSILLLGFGAVWITKDRLYAFLAPTQTVGGEVLVVEGWLSDEELMQAVERARDGRYRMILTTGGPLVQGSFLSEYKTYAELSLASLQRIGAALPVFAVPAPQVRRDRTYASALAVKHWLSEHHPKFRALDLVTAGPHARRSQLLYRKAFGDEFDIGIIALPPLSYSSEHWWMSSAGVRSVTGEVIAWLYASLLFSPSAEDSH